MALTDGIIWVKDFVFSLPGKVFDWFINLFLSLLDPVGFIKNVGKEIFDKINWIKD